jgi:outer membrane protein OmpA-like peptidoglycan-associated protein
MTNHQANVPSPSAKDLLILLVYLISTCSNNKTEPDMFNKLMIVVYCLLLWGCSSFQQPQVNDLKQRLQPFSITIISRTNVTKVILSTDVVFVRKTSELNSRAVPILHNIIHDLNAYPATKINIVGYTDNVGKERSNIIISEMRAKVIAAYFIRHHISVHRLHTRGYGESNPIASNITATGREQNRRVEIYFYQSQSGDNP